MKIVQSNITLSAVVIGLAFLAGCNKAPESPSSTTQPARPATTQQAKPADSKNQVVYYSAHLDEAKQVWHECQAKGLDALKAEEKENCAAAQSAWEMQPYRPGNRK